MNNASMNLVLTCFKNTTLLVGILLLTACQLNQKPQASAPLYSGILYSEQEKKQTSEQLTALLKQFQSWQLDSSPMSQSYRGKKTNYDQWDNLSDTFNQQQNIKIKLFLQDAKAIEKKALEYQQALSLDVLIYDLQQSIEFQSYYRLNYPLNQMFGLHTQVPTFMLNIHQIDTIQDARDYVARIRGVKPLFNELIKQLKAREALGINPPKFVYDSVIEASQTQLNGYPLDKSKTHHIIWTDFLKKVDSLGMYDSSKKVLTQGLKKALTRYYKPAYQKLIKHLTASSVNAGKDTGFHQFESGMAYYNLRLQAATTTDLNAQQIHNMGLKEIANIKQQIFELLPQLGFLNIESLFEYTRSNPDAFYQDGQQAISDSKTYINDINRQLHTAFSNIPNIPMEVKAVEAFREASAPVAFYQSASDDGKRPGRYYMNLSKLNEMPKFQFEALAYHETLPGHHLQSIYAISSKSIPEFRRRNNFTAYSEGWGLYAERLGKELGGYKTPWTEYGRLLMELWRANRLAIDTGLHSLGWDIDQALAFRLTNTPFSKADSINAIQRYLVMPGQATAYKIGQLKIIELRETAEKQLGGRFDLAEFHGLILNLGPLPLSLLEQQVNRWIASK
jgi:uncharacterized protein (DUF885 family)